MRWAWLVGVVVACSPKVDDLVLPLVQSGTALVITQEPGQPAQIYATEIADPPPPYLALSVPEGDAELWAIFNDCDLASLGLTAGWQTPTTDGPSQPLPAPSAVFARRYTNGQSEAWTRTEALPTELAAIRLPHTGDRCIELSAITQKIDGGLVSFRILQPLLARDGALAVTAEGKFYLVYRDRVQQITTSTMSPHSGGYRGQDGRVWLIGVDGTIGAWVDDGLPFRVVAVPPLPGFFKGRAWVDGSPDGREIFAMDQWGGMARFDARAGSWEVLNDTCRTAARFCENLDKGSVAWLGPGEAVFASDLPRFNRRFRDGTLVDEAYGAMDGDLAHTLLRDPSYGLVVATNGGKILSREADGWVLRFDANLLFQIDLMIRWERALFFGGDNGFLGQHHPGFAACPAHQIVAGDLRLVTTTDLGLVLAVKEFDPLGRPGASEYAVTFLDRITPPVPECARRASEVAGW